MLLRGTQSSLFAQSVGAQMACVRRITIAALGVLLEECEPAELQVLSLGFSYYTLGLAVPCPSLSDLVGGAVALSSRSWDCSWIHRMTELRSPVECRRHFTKSPAMHFI